MFAVEDLGKMIERVRLRQPVVHAINNLVTMSDVADALRSMGARPIMAFAAEEVSEIVSQADALVLNLGTPTPERITAMVLAGRQANLLKKPVIFDPVGAGASRFRIESTKRILSEVRMTVIKGNRAEIGSLAGREGRLRGLDAVSGPEDLRAAAELLSRETGTVVVISGHQDVVVQESRGIMVENGDPLMGQVTGTGCMLAGIIAAFAAVEDDAMMGTVAAVACFGLAGERAAKQARGLGTFKTALLDSLCELTAKDFAEGARIREWDTQGRVSRRSQRH